jgi:hypothetical protein
MCSRKRALSLKQIPQLIGNTLAYALAYVAINLNISQPDLVECFLKYCGLVEEAQSNMPGVRLDS